MADLNLDSAALDALFRRSESQHVLFPALRANVHDPWSVDTPAGVGAAWQDHRVYSFGPLRLTVRVDAGIEHRRTYTELRAIAGSILDQEDLPNLFVCGSQSPLCPRLPHSASDVDLVCFIPTRDFLSDVSRWIEIERRLAALTVRASQETGYSVDCGLLLNGFRHLPFMMDATAVDSDSDSMFWTYSKSEIAAELRRRWHRFASSSANDEWREVLDALISQVGQARVLQAVAQARWDDVTWSMRSPHWRRLISSYFGTPG